MNNALGVSLNNVKALFMRCSQKVGPFWGPRNVLFVLVIVVVVGDVITSSTSCFSMCVIITKMHPNSLWVSLDFE
jgi:hypothetical protein